MMRKIFAKAERATLVAGRYIDLDRAARWRKPALAIGTVGWAGRWILVAALGVEFFGGLTGEAEAAMIEPAAGPDSALKTAFYATAILGCMAIKWAGWTYGGIGYVHHRARSQGARPGAQAEKPLGVQRLHP